VRSAATLLAALAALAPSVVRAEPSEPRSSDDPLPRLGLRLAGPYEPTFTFEVRGTAGHDESLFGPFLSAYRAAPEILFNIRPEPNLEIFAGGGAGPAYVVPDPRAPVWVAARSAIAFSGALGARFPFQGAAVYAAARAEAVDGYGAAVMLRFAIDLAGLK
jgi:hypothetical protein